MERVQIPAARAELLKGRVPHHRRAAGVSQPLEKEEQPGNKKKGKNQKERVVKYTKSETER